MSKEQCQLSKKSENRLEYEKMVKAYRNSHAKRERRKAELLYLSELPTQADILSLVNDSPQIQAVQALLEGVVPQLVVANKRKLAKSEYQNLATFLAFCVLCYLQGNNRQFRKYSRIPIARIAQYLNEPLSDEAFDIGFLTIR